jgi:hypothetical protein
VLTFDIDGVICRPPLGINPGRGINKRRDGEGTRSVLWRTERWRYLGRRPMPGAREGFTALARDFDCKVVSARSADAAQLTAKWFERHIGVTPELWLRQDYREKPAQFKARMVVELGAVAHFEDDAHTAGWVAELLPQVFLIDWWRNRWLDAPNVHRLRSIGEAVPFLQGALLGAVEVADEGAAQE